MVTQEILSYIRAERQKGLNDETIRAQLKKANWQEKDIGDAFVYLKNEGDIKQASQAARNMQGLPGPIALLKEAWGIYKTRWVSYWGVILITYGFFILAGAIIFLALGATGVLAATILRDNLIAIIVVGLIFLLPAFFAFFFVSGWGQVALYHVIAFSDQKVRAWESFKKTKPSVLAFLWVGFLTSFTVMGGYFLFLIPGIIIAVWFSFATFVFVVEGKKGMQVLLASREYARGYWWAIFGRFFAIFVFFAAVSLVFILVIGFIDSISEGAKGFFNLVFNLGYAAVSPVFIFYHYLMYKYLRKMKGEVKIHESAKTKYILVGIGGIVLFVIGLGAGLWLLFSSVLNNPDLSQSILKEVMQNQQGFDDDTELNYWEDLPSESNPSNF